MTEIAIAVGDLLPTCAEVGGGWKKIVGINITASAGDDYPIVVGFMELILVLVSVVTIIPTTIAHLPFSPLMEQVTRGCVLEQEDIGFIGYYSHNVSIDGYYADGLSITYGSPRHHLWTYVAVILLIYDNLRDSYGYNCPCTVYGGLSPLCGRQLLL